MTEIWPIVTSGSSQLAPSVARAISLLVVMAMVAACAPTEPTMRSGTMPGQNAFLDFSELQPPSSPRTWLIAPVDAVAGAPDEAPPILAAPAERAAQAWIAMVKAQPRTRVVAVADDGLRVEAEQRSAVFGFVDKISARFIPLDGDRSTVALYSRAQIGYWDLGVNRRRLHDWLAALEERLGTASGPGERRVRGRLRRAAAGAPSRGADARRRWRAAPRRCVRSGRHRASFSDRRDREPHRARRPSAG